MGSQGTDKHIDDDEMNSVSSDDASLIINGQQRPARRSARQLSTLNDVSAENWKIKINQ
jgi:hypothetical protein